MINPKIPTINTIEQRYIDLLELLETITEESDIVVQTKAGALAASIRTLADHLDLQCRVSLENKFTLQKKVRSLRALEESLDFKLSASTKKIKESVTSSFELFKQTLKNT